MNIAPTEDLAACHMLRRAVFMDEQGISEADEFDDLDIHAIHFLARLGAHPIGTARVLRKGQTAKVGRVCVLKAHRGAGVGAALIHAACDWAVAQGLHRAELSAQVYAIPFYQTLGFMPYGDIYDDAGIPHRDMEKGL